MRTRAEIAETVRPCRNTQKDLLPLVEIEVLLDIRDQNKKIIEILEKLK